MSRYIGNYVRVPGSEPQQASAPGIWSISEQLNYQRANVWPPARDPYYNQTVLHLSGDVAGTKETNPVTQPRTFLSDASSNNFLLTPNGDVSARPFSPYGGNNYSVYFPGGTARVQFPSGNIIPASGTYTIECWIYPTSLNATYGGVIASQGTTPSGDNGRTGLSITAAGILTFGIGESFPSFNSGSNVIKLNQWTHVAITRNNTVFTMYINGNRINQVTSSKTTDSGFLRLGTLWDGDGNGLVPYVGYISNFRIVYSVLTDFTNRTDSLTAISNTALLTCQSNRFIDNSSNNYLATIVGSPQVSDNSPFVSYDTTSGSAYHDSSGDSLTIPTNTVFNFTGDFSVESWMFPMTTGVTVGIATKYVGGSLSGSEWYFVIDGANSRLGIALDNNSGEDYFTSATNSIIYNAWNHCLVTRVGNAVRLFVNGVLQGYNTTSRVLNTTSTVVTIGGNNNYQSDLRIVKNGIPSAYSTSATTIGSSIFTPPSRPISINDTLTSGSVSLLTLQTRAPANNQGILDTGPNSFVVTRNGNVAQGSFSPFSQSGWSYYYNGSSSHSAANSADFQFGTGDFSVEVWVNKTVASTGGFTRVFSIASTYGTAGKGVELERSHPSGNLETLISGDNTVVINTILTTTEAEWTNTWNHVVITRSSGVVKSFFNGVLKGSLNNTTNINGTNGLRLGDAIGGGQPLTGYISDFKVVKGTVPTLYQTSSTTVGATIFTPPSQPVTWSTGTVFLTAQNNRFIEQTGKSLTINGSPTVQPFSPFAPTQAYVASQIGGSGYFNGSTGYLTWPGSAIGTSPFCFECWFYPTSIGAVQTLFGNNSTSIGSISVRLITSTRIDIDRYNVASSQFTVPTMAANQWYHLVACRDASNNTTVFLNGVRSSTGTISDSYSYGNAASVGYLNSSFPQMFGGNIAAARLVTGSTPYDPTQTTITVPTAPPTAIPNTSLLLNFTNGGIVDATGKNVVETVDNSAVQTKIIQYGTGSMYFDGSGDYLKIQPGTFKFGTSNFTIEAWLYPTTAMAGEGDIIGFNFNSNLSSFASFRLIVANSQLKYVIGTSGTSWAHTVTTGSIPVNTWTHLAFVRNGSIFTPYINGIAGTTATNSSALYEGTAGSLVGAVLVNPVSSFFNGYMKEIRVTIGLARYSGSNTSAANFTPPTLPFPLA